jgi:hypothetical protein
MSKVSKESPLDQKKSKKESKLSDKAPWSGFNRDF